MNVNEVLVEIKSLSTPEHFEKLAHFGINDSKAYGVKIPLLRLLAKKIGKNHELALELWKTEIHEARLLATMIDDPKQVTENQFDSWVGDFNSWDMCDQCCGLFSKTPFVLSKIEIYSTAKEEFVKRTAFVLMCALVINNKKADNELFIPFFELIEREAWDDRNFVRKAVNWALRQIGKRNEILRVQAIECAERILKQEYKSACWIASDALRELRNEKIVAMVGNRKI
ncbi:MAG: DNA alkylation repair protein [Paludibacter sp.]|nr:DNA alkylation repair protein [Paludibacter sp.]